MTKNGLNSAKWSSRLSRNTRRTSANASSACKSSRQRISKSIAGITGGNIFHGELLLHQIFFLRPVPQWADFRTPLKGYYFGASGAHPGGGVMGAAGMLAAKEILKDGNW